LKLLVGGAGQLTLTKDGLTLLKDMQIQHPTAALIARTATAVDDIAGDGTTSTVLLTGELLKQAAVYVTEGLHSRVVTDGFDVARDAVLAFLTDFKVPCDPTDRELLQAVARTSLATKLDAAWVETVSY
jgi:T-complex protein 1 subunit zeta